MIEMAIDSIRVSLMNYQRVVILKEKLAERYLPIWIGPSEADAIAVKLQDVKVPRPLTHDLLGDVIGKLGASVNSIVITDLKNDTFFAKIILDVDGGTIEIDSRPSDALALAVRSGVPIMADEVVLDKAGIYLDQDNAKQLAEAEGGSDEARKVTDEELGKLSAFKDFINTLDLEDFNKRKS
jgi:bifunctional DNase/RNase